MSSKNGISEQTLPLFQNVPVEPPKRILVVDDDCDIRQLFAELLGRSGYTVDVAEDGAVGWKALKEAHRKPESYDLLITDNSMPKVNGFELVTKVRAESMDLPVIMVTVVVPENTAALKLSSVLLKPFTPGELLKTVARGLCKA